LAVFTLCLPNSISRHFTIDDRWLSIIEACHSRFANPPEHVISDTNRSISDHIAATHLIPSMTLQWPTLSQSDDLRYWSLLDDAQKREYLTLKLDLESLWNPKAPNLNHRFSQIISKVQRYISQNDGSNNDAKRSLVCGMIWWEDAIAISTPQFCKLVGKCKSTLNGGFKSLGYGIVPISFEFARRLSAAIPEMSANEWRRWTIRGKAGAVVAEVHDPRIRPEDLVDLDEVSDCEFIELWDEDGIR
jgi:hypothetical protein